MRTAVVLAAVALALVASGCGGSGKRVAQTSTTNTTCLGKAQQRDLAKLHRDLAALRAAGKIRSKDRLLGGPEVNKATDKFILDEETSKISPLMRNRLIDFAATAVVANCAQCFQALEAARPIPSIKFDGNGASCNR